MAAAAWAAWTAVALSAESARKGHVQQGINERKQDVETKKAEDKAKSQEAKNAAMRAAEAAKAKSQQEAVTKSPFANKKKGSMRSQFTVGGGGSDSGANY